LARADYGATDLETVIGALLAGQYNYPIRVIAFNPPSTGRKTSPKTLLANCVAAAQTAHVLLDAISKAAA
jgi:hypothetical protein